MHGFRSSEGSRRRSAGGRPEEPRIRRPWPHLHRPLQLRPPFSGEIHRPPRPLTFSARSKIPKSLIFCIIMPCSSRHNSASVAPFCACNMSNCSSRRVHHFIPLQHIHLRSSRCLNHRCKSASFCFLVSVYRTSSFVIFAMIDVCIL